MKTLSLAGAALTACLLSAPALADVNNGFGVATSARARNAYSLDSYVSAYRTTGDSSGNYTRPGDVPSVTIIGCQFGDPSVFCTGGASGTGGTNFNLTSSTSAAFRTDDAGGAPYPVSTGTASARSNLATGEIGVRASSDVWRDYRLAPTYNGADSFAQQNDTLTFTIAGADAFTTTNIGVEFLLEGSLSLIDTRSTAGLGQYMAFGNAYAQYGAFIGAGNDFASDFHTDRNWISGSWVISTPGFVKFTGVYALSGMSDTVGIYNQLYAYAGGSGTADYLNTSTLSLILPSNVSYTSASGTFLSAVNPLPGGVPEPAAWGMMIAGFGMVGLTMRRRARSPEVCA